MKLRFHVLFGILFFSGFAGLGYEMVWTRMLSIGLGHEIASMLAVVTAFFAGLAAGSWGLQRLLPRRGGPGRTYALLEMVIGTWSLILITAIPWSALVSARLMGPEPSFLLHWTVSFLVPFVLLLPATFAMGATLPVMNGLLVSLGEEQGLIARLYAVNTLGAVAGTLLPTFAVIPRIGYSSTLVGFAVINFLCGLSVFLLSRSRGKDIPETLAVPMSASSRALPLLLFSTGVLGIGYEVLIIRLLSQTLENTVYSFASVLSVYLFGTACGAALYGRLPPKRLSRDLAGALLALLAVLCLSSILLLPHSEALYQLVKERLGGGLLGCIIGEMGLAGAIFFLPTLVMGAIFSHFAEWAARERMGFGGALSINTLGAALAPVLFGVGLLPLMGAKLALIAVSAGYLLLLPLAAKRPLRLALVPASLIAFLLTATGPLVLVRLEDGETIVEHREGVMAAVTVLKDQSNEAHLKVNNRFQMGGTTSVFSDRRQAHIPLLLHPQPKHALFLGLGTGATFAAAADHPGLQADGVELVPEVIAAIPHFVKSTGDLSRSPQLSVVAADARRYAIASRKTYDVIVADLFHPARDGAGSLYTLEHFLAIRSRLNPGGVFCQWLPLYQMDLDMMQVVMRTFLEAFPNGTAYLAHYSLKAPIIGLIGSKDSLIYPSSYWEERTHDPLLRENLQNLRLDSFYSLLGCFLASSEELRAYSEGAVINTDDRPVITFGAPHFVYGTPEEPASRLLSVIDRFSPHPDQVLTDISTEGDRVARARLSSYWKARNHFIHAGVGVPETNDLKALLRHSRENLLEVVRTSPDFSSAYFPLLAMARGLYSKEPDDARNLLIQLEEANPVRNEAREVRRSLFKE